ncbi:MAG: acyl-CoA/acyl-ACP dehydrogenase [Taibaiella sp.]|nr:acyl-CoA/acyl-ACP dehydrogenase [Taibaiella sp.]
MNESFQHFQERFKAGLFNLFNTDANINELSINRGLPQNVWDSIMSFNPLAVAVPEAYGGKGVKVKECLAMISTASYESLPLALTFGINVGLFLQPFAKYANEGVKAHVFNRFMNHKAMGGLMITEPGYGSDALNMQTSYDELNNGFRLSGQKHWQGLTGMADFWIVAARKKVANGELARDVEFFVTDNSIPEQKIEVKQYFNNLGLYMIPYGLNNIDITVPANQKLEHHSTGIKMMLDILHRSRIQFAAMGVGFIQRMLDEAIEHCNQRKVGNCSLSSMDSVRYQLSRIQAAYTLASAMCGRATEMSGIAFDLSGEGIQANSMKALVSDLMQESAQICVQLSGSGGYKIDHIAGRGIIDSRPFQIFEGSNEMLYAQIAEVLTRQMKKYKQDNFYAYLQEYELTQRIAPLFKNHLNFSIPDILVQRQLIVIGRIVARLICLQFVASFTDKGFRKDLYENCIKHVEMDIKKFIADIKDYNNAEPVMDYQENSCWWQLL